MNDEEREESLNDELERLAPELVKGETHIIPAQYFEDLPAAILNRWPAGKSKHSAGLTWKQVLGIAALMTGMTIGAWFIFNQTDDRVLQPISSFEAYQYIQENIEDFEDLIEPEASYIPIEAEIPTEDIEEYLIEELQDSDPEELF